MPTPVTAPRTDPRAAGGRLVSVDGRTLPLRGVSLTAEAAGGLARSILRQIFHNPWDQPLEVSYTVPLPAEGAVSGFRMTMGDTLVQGRIESIGKAREQYETAMLEGRTAGLLDQERSNVFTLRVGNVPAGSRIETELVVDQRLAWQAHGEGGWEWRFPTVVAPRYLGSERRSPGGDRIAVDVADGLLPAGMSLRLSIGDDLAGVAAPSSPSHPLLVTGGEVTLAADQARLDRDLVVRWGAARLQPGVILRTAGHAAGAPRDQAVCGLLTIVPPSHPVAAVPRDLILLIDTSGSMAGPPLGQARRVAGLLIDSLGEHDRLEMIAFDTGPRRWRPGAVPAGAAMRREARAWLDALQAGGGTEMTEGLEETLRPLRHDAQRQVVLVTDGLIGFESEIILLLRDRLPRGSRLHTVGVGPAVNRALTGPAARAGRGVEVLLGSGEPGEEAGRRLVAALRAPVLMDLTLEGSALVDHAPRCLPDVMAGLPSLAAVRLHPAGGELTVRARGPAGSWQHTVHVPPVAPGEGSAAVMALYGREAVEDLEIDLAAGSSREEIDAAVERLGLEFGIATRVTSWVAISAGRTVDPADPFRTVRIPQELPAGLSAEGLGLDRRGLFAGDEVSMEVVSDTYQAPRGRHRAGSRETSLPVCRAWDPGLADVLLEARWLPRAHGERVARVEIRIHRGAVAWDPKGVVGFQLKDGTTREARILARHSTRRSHLQDGEVFRVGLDLEEDLDTEDLVMMLPAGGGPIVVVF